MSHTGAPFTATLGLPTFCCGHVRLTASLRAWSTQIFYRPLTLSKSTSQTAPHPQFWMACSPTLPCSTRRPFPGQTSCQEGQLASLRLTGSAKMCAGSFSCSRSRVVLSRTVNGINSSSMAACCTLTYNENRSGQSTSTETITCNTALQGMKAATPPEAHTNSVVHVSESQLPMCEGGGVLAPCGFALRKDQEARRVLSQE